MERAHRSVFAFVLLLMAVGCSRSGGPLPPTAGGEAGTGVWPVFHGPRGDNISDETGLLTAWPSDGPALLWAVEGIGEGYASVSIADGFLLTSGDVDGQNLVTAFDLAGQQRWQTAAGKGWTSSYEGTRGTPTIDGDRVFYETPHGEVVCLALQDGASVWQVNILERFDGRTNKWGQAESVIVDGDRVICSPGGSKASVAALDKSSGATLWTTPSTGGPAGYATPLIVDHEDMRIVLVMSGEGLLGVAADDGRLLFDFPLPTNYDVHATMPIYHAGQVFITAGYGSDAVMLRLNRQGDRVGVSEVWRNDQLDNHHGGVILYDGHLYGAADRANRAKWMCLDWASGAVRYAEKGVGKGSATLAEGMLYTLSERRKVALVPATPTGHEAAGTFTLPSGGNGPSWAHPVVCGGCLYLRHGDRLYCYDVRSSAP